jgi:hypothetical protein
VFLGLGRKAVDGQVGNGVLFRLVLILILLDTIQRLFGDTRPIDWLMLIVEVLVLILIAYEVAKPMIRRFRVRRRIAVVLGCVSEGMQLKQEASRLTVPDLDRWKDSIQTWSNTAFEKVNRMSPQAGDRFANVTSLRASSYLGIIPEAQDIYALLIYRLEVLRAIAGEPDVYL